MGHAHSTRLEPGRERTALPLQSGRPAGIGARVAHAGRTAGHGEGRAHPEGAEPLPNPPPRLSRREALHLLLHRRRRRPVQPPLRAPHHRRGALQVDLRPLRPFPSPLVAGRRADRLHCKPAPLSIRSRLAPLVADGDLRRPQREGAASEIPLETADGNPPGRGEGPGAPDEKRLPGSTDERPMENSIPPETATLASAFPGSLCSTPAGNSR